MITSSLTDDTLRPTVNDACILIPAYGAADKLSACLSSLAKFASRQYEVHVIDDATPNDTVRDVWAQFQSSWSNLKYHRNDKNLGFVKTCNWGCKNLRAPGGNLLLLNSDTEVTAGAIGEMLEVLYLHEKHSVVVPRSNDATIFSVPWVDGIYPPAESFILWERLHHLLPRYQLMPTAVGFCMLIKGSALDRFGLFDEIYTPGYNEENDFVCKINRYGYSVVAANWAYVFHYESSTFGQRRQQLEERNRRILLERYPEYERKISEYVRFELDPVEVFASLYAPHRPRLLFDLFHLTPFHCGTSQFALSLLRECARELQDTCDVYLGIGETFSFFAQDLTGYRRFDDSPSAQEIFDLVLKPSQIFTWNEFRRMSRLAPRLAYVLQDIIAVRCDYLSSTDRKILFRETAELSDCVVAISEFSRTDFNAYYGTNLAMPVIHLGTDFGVLPGEFRKGEYLLLMGNAYAHKAVADALPLLDRWPVMVFGGESKGSHPPNVRWFTSGGVSGLTVRELFIDARVVIYPSHYEGFGLPVVDALALRKPVIALDTAVNREVARVTGNQNLHLISSLDELPEMITSLLEQSRAFDFPSPRRWSDVGKDYARLINRLLNAEIDTDRMRRRWSALRTFESAGRALS